MYMKSIKYGKTITCLVILFLWDKMPEGNNIMNKIIICDDEENILKKLENKIQELQPKQWEIETVRTLKMLENMLETDIPDLIFLDILLDDGNGIDLACKIQKEHPYIPIIFITGYTEFAQEIFRIKPIYMLTKPFGDERIKDALNRAHDFIEKCHSKYIKIVSNGNIYNIDCKNICFVESNKRKVVIHTIDGKYEIYMSMKEFKTLLTDNFFSCHKSYVVNMNYIQKISKTEIVLSTGDCVPISRSNYKSVKENFMRHVMS